MMIILITVISQKLKGGITMGEWLVLTFIVAGIAFYAGQDSGKHKVHEENFVRSRAYDDVQWELNKLIKDIREEVK